MDHDQAQGSLPPAILPPTVAASSPWLGVLMVTGAASLWGTFSIFFRNAERIATEQGQHLSSATESFVFFGVVFVLLGPASLKKTSRPERPPAAYGWLLFFSIADALNVLLFFAAMQKTTVAVAVLTHYLAPVFVAVLAPILLRESKPAGIWPTVAAALFGLTLLLEPHRSQGEMSFVGAAFGSASALLFAGAILSMKRLGEWFSTTQILVWHYPCALLLLYCFIPSGELFTLSKEVLGILLLCGLLPGALGGFLFVEGVRRLPASRAGVLSLMEPLVAVVVGILVWGERPGLIAYLGGLIVLLAAYRVMTSPPAAQKI